MLLWPCPRLLALQAVMEWAWKRPMQSSFRFQALRLAAVSRQDWRRAGSANVSISKMGPPARTVQPPSLPRPAPRTGEMWVRGRDFAEEWFELVSPMSPVSPSLPTINLSMDKPLHQVRRIRSVLPCPDLPCAGLAGPIRPRFKIPYPARLDSTRLDLDLDWRTGLDLTDGQTGSPPDWFTRSASPTKGPTLAHQSLPAGHGDADWDWGSWVVEGKAREGGGHMQVLLHFPSQSCAVLYFPTRQGW